MRCLWTTLSVMLVRARFHVTLYLLLIVRMERCVRSLTRIPV